MKRIILLLSIFISFNVMLAQMSRYSQDALPSQYVSTVSSIKISSINLTGNLQELVIAIGFPDRNPTETYPRIWASTTYPLLGVFPNGTLLKDYVDQNGGSIPIDQWFEPGFDTYFNTHSNGVYNVNFAFVKQSNGNIYTTTHNYSYFYGLNGNSNISVMYNQRQIIISEVARKMVAANPGIFTGISSIHCIFNTPGNNDRNEFCSWASGTIDQSIILTDAGGTTLWTGPITLQWNPDDVIHERMHIIGTISGKPSGFEGFPDRGFDVSPGGAHHNLTWGYDVMSHNGTLPDQYSLYGLRPITTHDLIFLGWIKSDEILEIRNTNLNGIKLADVNYSLTAQQKTDGFCRTAKVMLHENYSGDLDEYYLIENHAATQFDKNFTNYDEPTNNKYNKGILVWHVQEKNNLLNLFYDNNIDLKPAISYNGYYGNPVPNDSYPRNYSRTNWNGITAGENDYLDDLYMSGSSFTYLPDGGRHVWETTTSGPYGWYPPAPQWFFRPMSQKSDFFTDAIVKGRVNSNLTALTTPSTKDWAGNQTYIAITNTRIITGGMAFDIKFNELGVIDQAATATNSQRKLVQDGSGNYHTVFSSGGEIFYRKNVSGTWQNPVKISYVNGSNYYPCIALGYSNSIMVVWQRNTGTNTYDVYFSISTDGGSTWLSSNKYTLETSLSSSAPLPVVARNNNNSRITVSYVGSSGLKSKTTTVSTPSQSSWTSQQITTSSEDSPSLSNCGTSSYNITAYGNSDSHIHYRYQNSDGSWSTNNRLSTMIPGASINRFPTISGMPSDGSVHLAWVRYDNSGGYPSNPRIYYMKNSSADGSWPYQYWSVTTGNQYEPNIAALASNKIDLLYVNDYNNLMYTRFDGSSWTSPVLKATSSSYPSISAGSTTAKYVYTNGTSSPFNVILSSETLSKVTEVEGKYTRSIAILDSSGAYIELQLHDMYFKMLDGSKQKIDFLPVTLDTFNITPINCWSLLISIKDNLIPPEASELLFDYTLNTENADKLFESRQNKVELEVKLNGKEEKLLGVKKGSEFDVASNKTTFKGEQIISLSDFNFDKSKEKVSFNLGLKMLIPKKGTFASLGHIFDFTDIELNKDLGKQASIINNEIPTEIELQNYPNPFNPSTKISFTIPQKSQIKLKVFDVLGREAANLAEGVYEAGKYEVTFNASNLPSGVYFYNLTTANGSISKKMLLIK